MYGGEGIFSYSLICHFPTCFAWREIILFNLMFGLRRLWPNRFSTSFAAPYWRKNSYSKFVCKVFKLKKICCTKVLDIKPLISYLSEYANSLTNISPVNSTSTSAKQKQNLSIFAKSLKIHSGGYDNRQIPLEGWKNILSNRLKPISNKIELY